MPATVVSFINYKGGVGKTTTTYHIGCALAQFHHKRVLLIDIDPQTNLTFLCAPVEDWQKVKQRQGTVATLYKRYVERQPLEVRTRIWRQPVSITSRHRIEGLDLIPCDIELLGEDLGVAQVVGNFPTLQALRKQADAYLRERSFLRRAIQEVANQYDYVLIDCPPNLYLMTQNALLASDWYVIPAIPDHLSTIGLNILRRKADQIMSTVTSAGNLTDGSAGPFGAAEFGGVVFVKVRLGGTRITNVHASTMAEVREQVGESKCFETFTTELIGYGEAAEYAVPVWSLLTPNAKKAANKNEYQSIAREFLEKF